MGRLRSAAPGSTSAQSTLRQQTLRWLLSEELTRAAEAGRRGDYRRANQALEAALGIDADCGAVYCEYAALIVARCKREKGAPAVHGNAAADLAKAEEHLQHALLDQGLQGQVRALRQSIAELRQRMG